MMRNAVWTAAALSFIALWSCHRAESPARVQRDLAQARTEAADKQAKADQKAAEAMAAAHQSLATESQRTDARDAAAAYDLAIARADGDHKISIAKCEGLSGGAQKACLDQADSEQALAKGRAEAARANHS
jgi:hypothetical protein